MATIIDGDGIVTVGGTSITQGRVRLNENTNNGTNYVELQAPASVPSTVTFTLPSADGTNGQIIQTNGSGVLTFANAASLATPLTVTGNSTAGAEIRLPEDTDNGSNYVALKAADNLASNVTFTLPSADGTSGQVLQTNASGTLSFANLAVANGGTGQTSLTSNNVILGNGTSAVQFVAPGTNGNILTSNGTTWQSTAPAGGGFSTMVVLTSGSSWAVPSGKTLAKVTVVGGGGGGGGGVSQGAGAGGGGGGTAIRYVTLTTGSATIAIGAGGTGGNSQFAGAAGGTTTFVYGAVSLSASGGAGGENGSGLNGGAGGTSSGGTLNITGNGGGPGLNHGGYGFGCPRGLGGGSSLGGGAASNSTPGTGTEYGGGGSGGGIGGAGSNGFQGVIVIEY